MVRFVPMRQPLRLWTMNRSLAMGEHWRVGRSVGRTLYNDDEILIGVMDTPELAALVVQAVNADGGLRQAAQAAYDALTLITRDVECFNFTGPPYCRGPNSGRDRESPFAASSWCDACIARDVLPALRSALAEKENTDG